MTKAKIFSGSSDQDLGVMSYHPSGRLYQLDYYFGSAIAQWSETPDPSGMARPADISLSIGESRVTRPGLGAMGYDGAGNIWKIGDSLRYTYDGLSRLKEFSVWDDDTSDFEPRTGYTYDRWGNLVQIRRPSASKAGGDVLNFDLVDIDLDGVPDDNRIDTLGDRESKTSVSLNWDTRGNLSQQPAVGPLRYKQFLWSGDDRLMESTDDPGGAETVWRYAYDAAGERVLKWGDFGSGLEATAFIRDESGRTISEWDLLSGGSGFDVHTDYLYGAGREIAELQQGTTRDKLLLVGIDHLGSTRATFDDTGLLENQKYPDYYPFGKLRVEADAETTHLFTGHERDMGAGSSELDYLHARYYSPVLGRFVSVDPVAGKVGSSQSANRYSYVLNNPVKFVDPDGRNERKGWKAGTVRNLSTKPIWVAADKGGKTMVLKLTPKQKSTILFTDTDAVVIAPGDPINGVSTGAYKIGTQDIDIKENKDGNLVLDRDNLEIIPNKIMGTAGFVNAAEAQKQGWVVPSSEGDSEGTTENEEGDKTPDVPVVEAPKSKKEDESK